MFNLLRRSKQRKCQISSKMQNTDTMIISSRDFKNQKNLPRVSEWQASSKLKRFAGTNKEEDLFEIEESEERERKINEARVSHHS